MVRPAAMHRGNDLRGLDSLSPVDPVVLVNPIRVPADRRDEFLDRYVATMEVVHRQPGFGGGGLLVAVDGRSAAFDFINLGRWTSREAYRAALRATDLGAAFGGLAESLHASPGLYRLERPYPPAFGDTTRLVQAYFDAARHDEAALLALLDPDVVMDVPASLPYGGIHRGHAGFQRVLRGFNSAWHDPVVSDLRIVAVDDAAVALSTLSARAGAGGRAFETRVAESFRVRGGRITEVRPFYADTAAMVAVLGPLHA